MFNTAARKFFEIFLGKVYYISSGYLKKANKTYNHVDNDYEMTLNENSQVEEAANEPVLIPETKFNFVPIDQLGQYLHKKELIDVIGVVQHVSSSLSIRRKFDNEIVPKRDITIANDTMKSVIVSLWGPFATSIVNKLLDMFDASSIVAIKSLKVSTFGGMALSTITNTIIDINPNNPESHTLKTWYGSEGSTTKFESMGSTFKPGLITNAPSMYPDRVGLDYITNNPSLGEAKPVYYTTRACMSFIKTSQPMYYHAYKTCNRKLSNNVGSGYSCEMCKTTQTDSNLRYVVSAKFSDTNGEAWMSLFANEAETIIGCSAAELDNMKSKDDGSAYQTQLKKGTWVPHVFRLMVAPKEYNNDKRQRIIVKIVSPVGYAAESKFLLDDISSTQS